MKYFFTVIIISSICLLHFNIASAQSVAINADGSAPNTNAMLDVKSTTKGLLIPRMTTAQRTAIANTTGLLVFDTDTKSFWYNDGSTWNNMAATPGWSITGNSGTVDGINFLGPTDNVPLNFKINGQLAGRIESAYYSGANRSNTFLGFQSGINNASGDYNISFGLNALLTNSSGNNNTAVGYASLLNSNSSNNTAIGDDALMYNTSGINNTALGSFTGSLNTTGNFNTVIGYNADVTQNNFTNATAIGANAKVAGSNIIQLGDANVTAIETNRNCTMIAGGYGTYSDARLKTLIKPLTLGLNFIEMLKPVTYLYKDEKDNHIHSGFIAQDVEKTAKQLGTDFSGVYAPDKTGKYYMLNYQDFIMPLVNAVQQQQQIINNQNKKIDALQKRLDKMEKIKAAN
jgi:endosialidase-like protein